VFPAEVSWSDQSQFPLAMLFCKQNSIKQIVVGILVKLLFIFAQLAAFVALLQI